MPPRISFVLTCCAIAAEENTIINFAWDQIDVTDASGVKYVFANVEFNEFSSQHLYNAENMQEYASTWHLTSIVLPNGRTIEFNYASATIESISHSETLNRTESSTGMDVHINCASVPGVSNSGYQSFEHFKELAHSKSYDISNINALYLEGISWDEGTLLIERNGGTSNIEVPRVSGFTLSNYRNKIINDIDLLYNTQQARTLLSEVIKDGIEKYTFENNPILAISENA